MIATNKDRLVEQSVLGEVSSPVASKGRWRVDPDGNPRMLPGVGGITYNCKVGDSALDWAADHVEPGVSIKNTDKDSNAAVNLLACVGNAATVVSGDAKGDSGVVTGTHGGVEHVLVDFPQETLEKLVIGDKIQIRARGLGLKLCDFPGVMLMNLDPNLLHSMGAAADGGRLQVPVTHKLPGAIMGSGIGNADTLSGDYDIQLFDPETVAEWGLADLRLGDVVAVLDHDNTYGRVHRRGAVSVGVVVHSCCTQAGHGPGVTTLMSSPHGVIDPVINPCANIAQYLKIGAARPQS